MFGKSKASDRTNLGTGAAPINCQYNPVKIKFTILLFLEQPFYENYPTLDSRDTRPFTLPSRWLSNRHKVGSVAYGSTKIEFLIFQNNRVFFASAFLSVQFKSNREYSVNSVFQSIPYIPYFTTDSVYSAIPPNRVTQISGWKKDRRPIGFLNR